MHIKSILAGTAIALVAGVGSASAAEQFTTLDGIAVEPMHAMELDGVRGKTHFPPGAIFVDSTEGDVVLLPNSSFPVSPPPLVVVDGDVAGGAQF